MPREKVILIEDDEDILDVLRYNLAREGYTVHECRDGERGLELVEEEGPDIVILDLMLPGLDGLEVCRRIKQTPATRSIPIVMVTAKSEESDVVLGLGLGADDYVTKPFSPREVVARVEAVLRRGPVRSQRSPPERVVQGPLTVDRARHEAWVDGKRLGLTATELRLLHCLATEPGRVFTRESLLERVIEGSAVVIRRNVDVHVRSIRKKLGEHRHLIETVRGVGYRFRVPVAD